jgi:hypothetical protein
MFVLENLAELDDARMNRVVTAGAYFRFQLFEEFWRRIVVDLLEEHFVGGRQDGQGWLIEFNAVGVARDGRVDELVKGSGSKSN